MGPHSGIIALALALASQGQGTPKAGPGVLAVVLAEKPKDTSLAHRLGRATTLRLGKAIGAEPVDLESAIAPEAKGERRKDIEAALKEVERGSRAFEELDLEKAGSILESSINTLLSYLDDLDDAQRKALESAIFQYGATTLFEGETDLGESIFVALVLIDPKYSPPQDQYPSNVVTRFENLKPTVPDRPTGGVKVLTTPEGADVYVDGIFKGPSPLQVAGLADGQHVVAARRLGYKPFGTLAPVTADHEASVEIDLEKAPGQEGLTEMSAALATDLRAVIQLGKDIHVERLAVLVLGGKHVTGMLADTEREVLIGRIRTLEILPDPEVGADAITAALLQGENAEIARAQAQAQAGGQASEKEGSITDRWWFWAILGGAVVAAAAGVTAWGISREGERHPPPNGIVLGF